jgi:hypothetical protein
VAENLRFGGKKNAGNHQTDESRGRKLRKERRGPLGNVGDATRSPELHHSVGDHGRYRDMGVENTYDGIIMPRTEDVGKWDETVIRGCERTIILKSVEKVSTLVAKGRRGCARIYWTMAKNGEHVSYSGKDAHVLCHSVRGEPRVDKKR